MSSKATAARAAAAEGDSKPRTITFGDGEDALTVELPRKFKRFKFMRAMARGDVAGCLDAIWPPSKGRDALGQDIDEPHPTVAQIEDLELDHEEFLDAFEQIGQHFGGTNLGNSSSSPA
ncbi:hypothetical protein [Actinomadura sp. SCN-SB]|jgi:hypothetical protein|uniref:hypothetical protein n=1 Tax=Actinomadura sp. SCN-SB TaxID=3373092 RepID=UPI003750DE62